MFRLSILLALSAAAAPAAPARFASPDGAFSLVPPAGFPFSRLVAGPGFGSAGGRFFVNFSANIETETAHPGSCHGTAFPAERRTARAYLDSWDACETYGRRGSALSISIQGKPEELKLEGGARLVYRVSRPRDAIELRRQGLDPKNYSSPRTRAAGGYLQVGDRIYRANAQLPDEESLRAWIKSMRTIRPGPAK